MDLNNLAPELIERAKTCKNADELVALANAEGVELTDEQLNQISGGNIWDEATYTEMKCPACGEKITWMGSSKAPKLCPYCGKPLK